MELALDFGQRDGVDASCATVELDSMAEQQATHATCIDSSHPGKLGNGVDGFELQASS